MGHSAGLHYGTVLAPTYQQYPDGNTNPSDIAQPKKDHSSYYAPNRYHHHTNGNGPSPHGDPPALNQKSAVNIRDMQSYAQHSVQQHHQGPYYPIQMLQVPNLALPYTQYPVPYTPATQAPAIGSHHISQNASVVRATMTTAQKNVKNIKIVHTVEPDNGQVLKRYKLGHYANPANNAPDAPVSKARVPQAGGKTIEVWRCAKASYRFCTMTANGYTDLTANLAKSHNIFDVATTKKAYKDKGKTTAQAQQAMAAPMGMNAYPGSQGASYNAGPTAGPPHPAFTASSILIGQAIAQPASTTITGRDNSHPSTPADYAVDNGRITTKLTQEDALLQRNLTEGLKKPEYVATLNPAVLMLGFNGGLASDEEMAGFNGNGIEAQGGMGEADLYGYSPPTKRRKVGGQNYGQGTEFPGTSCQFRHSPVNPRMLARALNRRTMESL
ncbi:hypothetical protein B0A55_01390 [Friedmanniomyces simplex]|uniref:Uncharacterized protein n=1 Tax=Friedmanniomyces simplex TaxID=329884 RepID=A0A4U0Y2J1_9PEZI|nr:hypothetical protein B0A55_01390 [Friedmanniomyces simplex]